MTGWRDDLATPRRKLEIEWNCGNCGATVDVSRWETELARLEAELRDAQSITHSGLVTRTLQRAEADEAEVTRLQEGLRQIEEFSYPLNGTLEAIVAMKAIARSLLADNQEASEPDTPDPGSFGGHPYTPTERALGYGTDNDPRLRSSDRSGPTPAEGDEWEARCHFCGGPCYPWLTDNETWAKVEPTLGQQQACFECFAAAWFKLGHNNGEPFRVSAGPDTPADSQPEDGTA